MKEETLKSIPSLGDLEARFEFIKNQTLRENVTVYFRYIIFLLALSEDEELDTLTYSLYKDIVIHTASIVECTVEYAVKQYIAVGKAKEDIFGFSWHFCEIGNINHDCNDFRQAQFVVARKEKKLKTGARDLDFADINNAARGCGVLDSELFKKADSLRKQRNQIHLSSLEKSTNDYIVKKDLQEALSNAHDIIVRVEQVLGEL